MRNTFHRQDFFRSKRKIQHIYKKCPIYEKIDNQKGRLVCNKLLKIIYENPRKVTCIRCGKACHGSSF